MARLWLVLFLSASAHADHIVMKCGKNAKQWANPTPAAEYHFEADGWEVNESTVNWGWFKNGKQDKNVTKAAYVDRANQTAWVFTEKKPAAGKPYRQYFVNFTGSCDGAEHLAGWLSIFELGQGGKRKVGASKPCHCISD